MLKNRMLSVMAGAIIVVGGLNVMAYAANGHPLLLGHGNAESKTATAANSGNGPALSLKSRAKYPSLAVSSSKRVKHLNADRVDGKNAADLLTAAKTWTIPPGTDLSYVLNGVKPGKYLGTLNIITDSTSANVCELDETGQPSQVLTYGANRAGFFSNASGAGLFVHHAGSPVTLACGDATDIYAGGQPSTVTLLPLGKVTTGSTTGAKHAQHGKHAGAATHGPSAR